MTSKVIFISPEVPDRALLQWIPPLLDQGLDFFHLRFPNADWNVYEEVLSSIPSPYFSRLVIHGPVNWAEEKQGLRWHASASRLEEARNGQYHSVSLHAENEFSVLPFVHYGFFSPFFPSIAKPGYGKPVSEMEWSNRIKTWELSVREKIVALGGLEKRHVTFLSALGLGGLAFMGAWQRETDPVQFLKSIQHEIRH